MDQNKLKQLQHKVVRNIYEINKTKHTFSKVCNRKSTNPSHLADKANF